MADYQTVRGMHDILPGETLRWARIEAVLRDVLGEFGFEEIRTPLLEESALFERSVGEGTDIVEKELYSFNDRKGRKLALRPEGTASAARAYIQSEMNARRRVARLFYQGPMFRYDRPQKGRYRQFSQTGVEVFGGAHPFFDGEMIRLLAEIFRRVGAPGFSAQVSSLGCAGCRERFTAAMREALLGRADALCEDCRRRVAANPLRVLDCKNAGCRDAVRESVGGGAALCAECSAHFDGVRAYLDAFGVPYEVNRFLVRGLDYYTRTVFEAFAGESGNAVAAGGRYDDLVRQLGGPSVPAVGWAIGMERLLEIASPPPDERPVVAGIFLGDRARIEGAKLADRLRRAGVRVAADYDERSLKAHLKTADREGAGWCVIAGDDELAAGTAIVKNMKTGGQEIVPLDAVADKLRGITEC